MDDFLEWLGQSMIDNWLYTVAFCVWSGLSLSAGVAGVMHLFAISYKLPLALAFVIVPPAVAYLIYRKGTRK